MAHNRSHIGEEGISQCRSKRQHRWLSILPTIFAAVAGFGSSVILSSCASTQPAVSEIAKADSLAPIYYFDTWGIGKSGWKARHLGDSEETVVHSTGLGTSLLSGGGGQISFDETNSPSGRFIAAEHDNGPAIRFSGRYVDFGIIDVAKDDFILGISAKSRYPEYKSDQYRIEWSAIDSGFFYITDDTLYKCYPDGRRTISIYRDRLRAFSVSPDEQELLIAYGDTVALCTPDGATKAIVAVDMDSRKGIRGASWSPDGSAVAFSTGWRLYTYDIAGRTLKELKADGLVPWTEWLPDGSLVFSEGDVPSDLQTIPTSPTSRIRRYWPSTGEIATIHQRLNQSPIVMHPHLSPSGKLLLFAEKRLNGGYAVKLMTLDGLQMSELFDGSDPRWGR